MEPISNNNPETFLTLLMANQRKINSYVLSLVPDFNDADDIMQETISTMWKKFDQFEMGTDFTAWGVRIAYYNIMNFRKKRSRDKLVFNDDVFRQVCEVSEEKHKETDVRIQMLRKCMKKLNETDQRLLKARYELGSSVKSLATQLSKSTQFVYKHLSRIHYSLNNCVKNNNAEKVRL